MNSILRNRIRIKVLGGAVAAALVLATPMATAAQAADKKPIKIGFSMALTGALAGGGKQALEGMELWRSDANSKGGLLGRKVEFVYYDDQTNAKNVPGIYSKLIDVDKVDLVVSGYGTNLICPAMPIVIDRDILFMGLFGMDNNKKWKYDKYLLLRN
jgi:branched-chain amino acid transport system substrate-binding protein